MKKIIFHLDMDCFFVSALRTIRHDLKNKQVAVATFDQARQSYLKSIASSISYEAKAKGAKVPWTIEKIKKYCHELVIVEPDYTLFSQLANDIFEFISKKFTKNIEVLSIDECFIDVSSLVDTYENALDLAQKMQNDILINLKMPCSIGISYNKFFAKMASPMRKPAGIMIITEDNYQRILFDLYVCKIYGVGQATVNILKQNNINKIKDLNKEDNWYYLYKTIGKNRFKGILNNINGRGSDILNYERNNFKEIGNSISMHSFLYDNREDILKIYRDLLSKVILRLKSRNYIASNIGISIKYSHTNSVSTQMSFANATSDYDIFYGYLLKLFDKIWNFDPVKGIGVKIGKFKDIFDTKYTMDLFNPLTIEVKNEDSQIHKVINDINKKFDKKIVYTAKEYNENAKLKQNQSKFIDSNFFKK